eukprot:6484558-Pyramimonas_sp.AAC.1
MVDGIASGARLTTSGATLDTMASRLKCSVPAPKKKDKLNSVKTTLVGSEAAKHIFKRVEDESPEKRQES